MTFASSVLTNRRISEHSKTHGYRKATVANNEVAGDDWYAQMIARFEVGTEGSNRPVLTYGEDETSISATANIQQDIEQGPSESVEAKEPCM